MDRDMFAEIFNESKFEEPVDQCNHINIIIDGYYTCTLCGTVDIHRYVFVEPIILEKTHNYQLYQRKSYFREKLKLMVGIKQSTNQKYQTIITELKKHSFNSITELKKLMRKKGYHQYYKYIYTIYYEIKGIKLIDLTYIDIENLTCKFLKLEDQFKKLYPKKSNLLSYNIIIYVLLKKYDHQCYKNIILPKNKRKILKNIENLVTKLVM